MSKHMFTSSRHASTACAGTVMGTGSASAKTGVPREMWDTSSALRETFSQNGYKNIQQMLSTMDEYNKFSKSLEETVLGGHARTDQLLASIGREATVKRSLGTTQSPTVQTGRGENSSRSFTSTRNAEPEDRHQNQAGNHKEVKYA